MYMHAVKSILFPQGRGIHMPCQSLGSTLKKVRRPQMKGCMEKALSDV